MGGDIVAESSEGKGSVFTATIMVGLCNQEEKDAVRSEVNNAGEDNASLYGKRILIAEDNEINQEVVKGLLHFVNMETDFASDGQEALNKFSSSAPGTYDAILMDIQMPIMDGHQTTRAIRLLSHPQAKDIPILAMTADAFTEDISAAFACGMNGHIAKPIDQKELYRKLDQAIRHLKIS